MAKKFYAVRSGRTPGIYTTWKECQREIIGFKGAAFKGFETYEEAEAFIGAGEDKSTEPREGAAVAYVDGSFNIKTKKFSYGMIILYNGEEYTQNESFDDASLAEMRNVAGEIRGSMEAMLYAVEHSILIFIMTIRVLRAGV